MLGVSPGSAINRIAQVLDVRDRHPVLWDAMLAGTIHFFQASLVADECFKPYGSTPARSCDADHTVAYQPAHHGQTHLGNLGNLPRFAHRAKTAGKVRVDQVEPGVFHWRYQSGPEFLVTREGTTRLRTPGDQSVWSDFIFRSVILTS